MSVPESRLSHNGTQRGAMCSDVAPAEVAEESEFLFPSKKAVRTRMRSKAQPDGRPAVELIETLVRLSLSPTRATPLFN